MRDATRKQLKWSAVLVAIGSAATLLIGGCPSEPILPTNLDVSLQYMLDNPTGFEQYTDTASTIRAGEVKDALANLNGCWGVILKNDGQTSSGASIDHYSLLRFGADQSLVTRDYGDAGGTYVYLYTAHGRWEVVADDRVQFIFDEYRVYNSNTGRYTVYTPETEDVTEALATLDGTVLRLRVLDNPGDPVPADTEPNYTTLYQQFTCAD